MIVFSRRKSLEENVHRRFFRSVTSVLLEALNIFWIKENEKWQDL